MVRNEKEMRKKAESEADLESETLAKKEPMALLRLLLLSRHQHYTHLIKSHNRTQNLRLKKNV